MFKLLAIRPLPGCAPYIQKCLKTGMMYYFCNDYIIEPYSHIRRRSKNVKPLKEDFFSVPATADGAEDEYKKYTGPTVSVSALVGMNGDGKSTLVELMMRLINNCAISYDLRVSKDNLRRVEGTKAELYYLIDNSVYRMAEGEKDKKTLIWKIVELNDNPNGCELMRWEMHSTKIESIEEHFFFTFISNYSHYAYNSNDYKREWVEHGSEKEDDEKCWLHYLFHKNDGYLTPITLHPCRKDGIIDINNEITLSKQRLLSLFLGAENPSADPRSFRRVNGKDANVLKLSEVPSSKLQQIAILAYFKATSQENQFNDLLEELDKVNDEIYQASMLLDSGKDYYNDFSALNEQLLPLRFVKPINDIIEQDEGFCVFAKAVMGWIKKESGKKNKQHDGDIMTVLREYEKLFRWNETYLQIGQYTQKAKTHEQAGRYTSALEDYKEAVKLSETKLGTEHIFNAITYNNVAVAYENLGNYADSLSFHKKALELKQRLLGDKHHSSIATSYNNVGSTYGKLGQFPKALDYQLKALYIRLDIFGEKHPEVAGSYNNVGSSYGSLGDEKKALEYKEKALEIRLALFGENHPDVAKSYNSVGISYGNLGDEKKALEYEEKALEIQRALFGENHPDVAKSYNSVGVSYGLLGDEKKALEYKEKALGIRLALFGENHPDVAQSYNNVGCSYSTLGDEKKALEYEEKALGIRLTLFGENHPDVAQSYNNVGNSYELLGDEKKALEYEEKALEIYRALFGENHPDVAQSYNNVGISYGLLGDEKKALEYKEKALGIRLALFGENHPDVANSYTSVGFSYSALGDEKKALGFTEKALEIYRALFGEKHPNVALLYSSVGASYEKLGNDGKAEAYFDKASSIRKDLLGTGHSETVQTTESTVDKQIKGETQKGKQNLQETIIIEGHQTVIKNDDLRNNRRIGEYKQSRMVEGFSSMEEIEIIGNNIEDAERIVAFKQELPDTKKHDYLKFINAAQLGRLDTLYRIMKACGYDQRIVSKAFSDLSIEEKCQHYVVYKIWSILSTYPKFKDALSKDNRWSLREFGPKMEERLEEIKRDRLSHITRKLRQVECFIDEGLNGDGLYGRLGKKGNKTGEIMVGLDKLREHYRGRAFSLDNLPPPIYQWDIVFTKPDNPDCSIDLDSLSSGEKQLLNSMAAIIYHLQNLASSSSEVKYDNVNLILEEIELYYHPEYQRLFFYRLLDMMQRAKLDNIRNINIVFVTHSPFILSDIPKCNVLFLKDGMPKDIMQENTFGANIHTLLKNGFFMPNLPIGEFAYGKINNLFGRLNSGELNPDTDLDDIYQEILLVGEPFLRNQLLMLYNSYKGSRLLTRN